MEIKAKSNYIRISPRKMRLLTRLLVGKKAIDCLPILANLTQSSAQPVADLIKQGLGNAVNNFSLDRESLIIKSLQATKGPILKRGRPVSRGRWHPILKRTSHLYLILEGKPASESVKKSEKIKNKVKVRKVKTGAAGKTKAGKEKNHGSKS